MIDETLKILSYHRGLHNTPDGDCDCCEKAAKPSLIELERASRKDRSKKRQKVMDDFFRNLADAVTNFESDVLSILELPNLRRIREAELSDEQGEGTWKLTKPMRKQYEKRLLEFGRLVLGSKLWEIKEQKQYANEDGIYPTYTLNAFTVGMDETIDQALRDIDPAYGDPEELRRLQMQATAQNAYLDAVNREGGKRIKTHLAKEYMKDVLISLNNMAEDGISPIAIGRELHNAVGEGHLWYWMRIARSESALAWNAAFDYIQEKFQVPYERWSAGAGACQICTFFDGKTWPRGEGPSPVESTHPYCLCHLESVWVTQDQPQQAWVRPSPYEQPYSADELEAMRQLTELQGRG